MIISMKHLEVVGLRKELHETTKLLQELGVTHIHETHPRESKAGKFLRPVAIEEKKAAEREKLDAMENLLKEVMPIVRASGRPGKSSTSCLEDPAAFESVLAGLKADHDALIGLTKKKNDAAAALEMAGKYREILKILPDVLRASQSTAAVDYFAISIEKSSLADLKHGLAGDADRTVSLRTAKWKGNQLLGVVSFPAGKAEEVKDLAWKHGATEVVLPSEFRGRPIKDSLEEIENRLSALPKDMAKLEKDIRAYTAENGARLNRLNQEVEDVLDRFRTLANIGQSKYLFVLSTWTPSEHVKRVVTALKDRFKDAVSVNEIGAENWGQEEVPVTLNNPGFLRPFQLLLKVFPPPMYGSVDATIFLFLFFPVFFGLIAGDAGYGALMVALFWWIRRKAAGNETLKAVTTVGFWCAGWTIACGLLFGEVFGSFFHHMGWIKPIWEDRILITTQYLILSIAIGVVHIYLGLGLGFYLGVKHGHLKHATEKLGFAIFLTGALTAIAGKLIETAPAVLYPSGLGLIGLSVALLIWSAGVAGIIEIFSLISNIISYARIMAVGIASVSLAEVANSLGGAGEGVWAVVAIIGAILVHLFNLVLAIFDPTIQGLRLHYVEFFTKFYESGGKEFQPLQKRA